MEIRDPKILEAILNLPGGFIELQRTNKAEFLRLQTQIEALPQKIFNTKFKVKNGSEKEKSLQDLLIESYEKTERLGREINTGEIFVPVDNIEGKMQMWKLKDILSELRLKPSSMFRKGANISDGLIKIGTVIAGLSITIYIIVTLLKGTQ